MVKKGGYANTLPLSWKIAFLVIAVFLFAIVLYSAGKAVLGTSKLCYVCHEMRPEYYTAVVSTHAKISCSQCHLNQSDLGQGLSYLLPMVKAKFRETYYLPVTLSSTQLSSEICSSCHNMSRREVTPGLDLIIPHQIHQENEVDCLSCHTGLVHNQISKRQLTIDGDWAKWSLDYARKIRKPIHYSVSMDDCMECHEGRKASLDCAACHLRIRLPQDHLQEKWDKFHGKIAIERVQYCHECHSNGIDHNNRSTSFVTKDYVEVNEFCKSCHFVRPKGHSENWRRLHGPESRRSDCSVCHRQKVFNNKQATISCIECHKNTHEKPLDTHPVPIKKPINFQDCRYCHPLERCLQCHV